MSVDEAIEKRSDLLKEAEAIELSASACLKKNTVPELKTAVSMLIGIRRLNKEVDETFNDIVSAAHKAHKTATTRKKKFSAPLTVAETIIKGKITEYYKWEDAAMGTRYAEDMKTARETAETVRLAEVEELRESGMLDQAEALASSSLILAPPPKPTPTKVDGISLTETWKAEIDDEVELISFIHENPQWAHLLTINMKELNTLARMQRESMSLPGVKAVKTKGVTIRLPAE